MLSPPCSLTSLGNGFSISPHLGFANHIITGLKGTSSQKPGERGGDGEGKRSGRVGERKQELGSAL